MWSNAKIQPVAVQFLFGAYLYIISYYGNIGPVGERGGGEGCCHHFHGGDMYALTLLSVNAYMSP